MSRQPSGLISLNLSKNIENEKPKLAHPLLYLKSLLTFRNLNIFYKIFCLLSILTILVNVKIK
jgi:hypothetical protein